MADPPDGQFSVPPAFEGGVGGLVSTANDYLAFVSALLAGGTYRGTRVLSRPSVTLMTSDHLSSTQRAVTGFWPGYFDTASWGFGMGVVTRRTHLGPSAEATGGPVTTAPPGTTIPPRTCRRSSSCSGPTPATNGC